ncbi:helix-turn-helix domain-containing protein [Streptomyces sp. NPDC001339]|uniref:helix-turn-helix domain-containing protein n=1 Tax=Streptomyces sp. NPDC001339 TaxID=3364563 RepID=UPI0036782747
MSDTNLDTTPTSDSTSTPEPLTGLTGAAADVYTELLGLTEPVTVAELAHIAGIGHSTAGRAVAALEKRGLATRTRGGHDGPRRMPDLWHPVTRASAPEATNSDMSEHGEQPTDAQPESSPTDSAKPVDDDVECGEDTSGPSTSDASGMPDPDSLGHTSTDDANVPADTLPDDISNTTPANNTNSYTEPEADTPQVDPPQNTEQPDGDNSQDHGSQSETNDTPTSSEGIEATSAPAQPVPAKDGRLAPGALRQMVIDHLHAHPDEAFTATRISRIIDKSSGAIANALEKLASQGITEQVTDRPRMFRLANTVVNNTK